jgi:amino acid transporter
MAKADSKNTQQNKDVSQLHSMGYAQELSRRMGGFSNFAISFSIICILAGGITTFQVAFSATGGAGVGLGWPVGGLFAIIVALSMGQIASSYPTAGGLYHWSSILGGRFWGWATAWFNLVGLIFVVSSVAAGAFILFENLILNGIFGVDVSGAAWQASGTGTLPGWIWLLGTAVILVTYAIFNHYGIRLTTILTDFSGYLIFVVAIALTITLVAFAGHLDFSRLFTFTNFTGDPGGGVWPQTSSMLYAFVVGLLLVTYTVTGYDASAHTSEETRDAAVNVPRGMWQSVFWSVLFGYFMVCAFVLAMPDIAKGAAQGGNVFGWLMTNSPMPAILRDILFIGIVIANYICGLAGLTSLSRMMYAFSRDGGLPGSKFISNVSVTYRTPTVAIWVSAALALLSVLYGGAFVVLAAGCAVFLYLSYIMPVFAGLLAEGKTWTTKGPFSLGGWSKANAVLAILGGLVLVWVGFQPPNQAVGWAIVGMVVLMAILWYLVGVRRTFAGPPKGDVITQRQKMIAEQEAKFKGSAAD